MMLFLIEYNRPKGLIVTMRTFDASERTRAHDARLKLELDLHRKGIDREVVLLEADSEATIRKTHGRYFYSLKEIIQSFAEELRASIRFPPSQDQ